MPRHLVLLPELFTINGGTIDNTTVGAITTLNYPQAWNGDFAFTGTRNLNLGTGAVTLNASIVVTVNANTLTAGGIINGNSFNLTKAGTGVLSFGSNTVTLKDLTINAGMLTATSSTLNLGGDFNNSGTFTHNSGLVNFNGGLAQSIGGATVTTFNNLTLNNSNGLTVNINTNINNTLTLTNGNLIISTGSTLNITSGNAVSGAGIGVAKHIVTQVNTSTGEKGFLRMGGFTGSLTFPVGNGTYYMPVLLSATGINDFSVCVFPGRH